jgi:hypothetical protein
MIQYLNDGKVALSHAVLLESHFGQFLFSMVSQEFMDPDNVALQVNVVFEGNEPNNSMARDCTPHPNNDRVKDSFCQQDANIL